MTDQVPHAPWTRDPGHLQHRHDVVVIGGGVTGVHIARELAGRGISVLLLEKDDIAAGASASVARHLHGALAFLFDGDVRSAIEAVRERSAVAASAPHLVRARRTVVPVWDWSRPGRFALGARLAAYDGLFASGPDGRRRARRPLGAGRMTWMAPAAALTAAPWLRAEGLTGAFGCYDLISEHPGRLVLSIARSAVDLGADVLTHARVVRILTEPGPVGDTVFGLEVVDERTGTVHATHTDLVVNAAGAWANDALGDLGPRLRLPLDRARSVQVLARPLGGSSSILARTRTGGTVDVSTWQRLSLIESSGVPVPLSDDDNSATVDAIGLLRSGINGISAEPIGPGDLRDVTLVDQVRDHGARSGPQRPRIHRHDGSHIFGLMTVTGGTPTTARATGVEVAETIVRSARLGPTRPFDSRRRSVHGAIDDAMRAEIVRSLAADGVVDHDTADHLVRLYGSDAAAVVDLVRERPELGRQLSADEDRRDIAAQALHAVTDEAALSLADVVRRLALGGPGAPRPDDVRAVAAVLGPVLGWDDDQTNQEVQSAMSRRTSLADVVGAWAAPA